MGVSRFPLRVLVVSVLFRFTEECPCSQERVSPVLLTLHFSGGVYPCEKKDEKGKGRGKHTHGPYPPPRLAPAPPPPPPIYSDSDVIPCLPSPPPFWCTHVSSLDRCYLRGEGIRSLDHRKESTSTSLPMGGSNRVVERRPRGREG